MYNLTILTTRELQTKTMRHIFFYFIRNKKEKSLLSIIGYKLGKVVFSVCSYSENINCMAIATLSRMLVEDTITLARDEVYFISQYSNTIQESILLHWIPKPKFLQDVIKRGQIASIHAMGLYCRGRDLSIGRNYYTVE